MRKTSTNLFINLFRIIRTQNTKNLKFLNNNSMLEPCFLPLRAIYRKWEITRTRFSKDAAVFADICYLEG